MKPTDLLALIALVALILVGAVGISLWQDYVRVKPLNVEGLK